MIFRSSCFPPVLVSAFCLLRWVVPHLTLGSGIHQSHRQMGDTISFFLSRWLLICDIHLTLAPYRVVDWLNCRNYMSLVRWRDGICLFKNRKLESQIRIAKWWRSWWHNYIPARRKFLANAWSDDASQKKNPQKERPWQASCREQMGDWQGSETATVALYLHTYVIITGRYCT